MKKILGNVQPIAGADYPEEDARSHDFIYLADRSIDPDKTELVDGWERVDGYRGVIRATSTGQLFTARLA